MKKRSLTILFFVMALSIASASIQLSEVERVYNIGDEIAISLTINPSRVDGNFEIRVECEDSSETFYKISPARSAFSPNQETRINHRIILEKEFIGNLSGDCILIAELGNIKTQTDKFEITSSINVNVKLDKERYDPGESIVLDIEAIKANGRRLEGFVRSEGEFSFEKRIENGNAREVFTTPQTQEAGEYTLNLFIYEQGRQGEIINYQNVTKNFRINQIPYSVPITLSSSDVNPGETFEFKAELFDQSGSEMHGIISVEFVSPLRERIQVSLESGELQEIEFPTNATAGNWKIYSNHGRLTEERIIRMNEKAKLNFSFDERASVLIVKNIGNAEHRGNVKIDIGEETRNITLNIKPGEERRFTLSAPTGEHDVRIQGGDSSVERRLLLTGQVVDVREYRRYLNISEYPAVWSIIFTLIVLLLIIIFFRYHKKTFYIKNKLKTKFENIKSVKSDKQGDKILETREKPKVNNAEQTLVTKGIKEPSTIITISLKNKLTPFIKENFLKTISEIAEKNNGAIEVKEKEIHIIFSPRKTRTYKNEYNSVKTSLEILNKIKESNRKFKDKIDFGIGISSGDLIGSIQNNKLKYTSVDKTIAISKKTSDIANQNIIIAESVKNKLLREIKTEKVESSGNTYYKIIEVSEKQGNQEKLKDLLKRTHLKE